MAGNSNRRKIYLLRGEGAHAVFNGPLKVFYRRAFQRREDAEDLNIRAELAAAMRDSERYPLAYALSEGEYPITFKILEFELDEVDADVLLELANG